MDSIINKFVEHIIWFGTLQKKTHRESLKNDHSIFDTISHIVVVVFDEYDKIYQLKKRRFVLFFREKTSKLISKVMFRKRIRCHNKHITHISTGVSASDVHDFCHIRHIPVSRSARTYNVPVPCTPVSSRRLL